MDGLFTRDGHLSELTINRLLQGELDGVSVLTEHLEACGECTRAVSAVRAFDGDLGLVPPTVHSTTGPGWPVYAGVMALAAALAFFVLRPTDGVEPSPVTPEVFRLKGSFDFQIFAHDGQASRVVDTGGQVYPGERLGFRLGPKATGHLLVVGTDGKGAPYLCYPQDTGGTSRKMVPTKEARDLNQAVRLDAVLGSEAIVALLCEVPISLAEASEVLVGQGVAPDALPVVRKDCRQRVIHLAKVAPKAP